MADFFFVFFKQKTAYEMRISDWSSDVCSSDLLREHAAHHGRLVRRGRRGSRGSHGAALRLRARCPGRLLATHRAQHQLTADLGVPRRQGQIGRASCRERVCQYGYIAVVAGSLKTNNKQQITQTYKYYTH